MNSQVTSKLAALVAALTINGLIMVAVAHLFDGRLHEVTGAVAVVPTISQPAQAVG